MKTIEIDGKPYPVERVRKALKLYQALQDGSLEEEIKEMMR